MKKELVSNLFVLLIGAGFIIASLDLRIGSVHRPGPGFMPLFASIFLTLVAFFSLPGSYFRAKREKTIGREKFLQRSALNVVIILVAMFIYIILLSWLGYSLSTFVLLIFLFKMGGFRKWVYILSSAFLATFFSYLLFCYCLSLRFPKLFGY